MNCRYCGAQNDGDAIYCGQCGYQLIDDETLVHSPYDTLDTSAPTVPNTIPDVRDLIKRGEKFQSRGSFEKALYVFDEVIRLDPNNEIAHLWRERALIGLERYEEVLSDFDEAVRLHPNNSYISELQKLKDLALSQLRKLGR